MLHIDSIEKGLDIFKALGSEVRVAIIMQLLKNPGMNMNELAASLNITNGALTSHIKKLEACGIISISNETAGHGNQKICSVHEDKILIELANSVAQLPSEKPEKLTERFVRGDSARTQKNGGSGIGLAAARRICEKHHGRLTIDYPDGHTFRVKVEL